MARLGTFSRALREGEVLVALAALFACQVHEAVGDWAQVGAQTFQGNSELHVAVTPGLDRVAASVSFPGPDRGDFLALYSSSGQQLWTYHPEGPAKVRAEGIARDGSTVVAFVTPYPEKELPPRDPVDRPDAPPPAGSVVFLSGVTGEPMGALVLEPGDWGVQISRDASVLLVAGYNPRVLGRDGTVLCRLNSLRPPLPGNTDGTFWQDAVILLSPEGTYVLVRCGNALYQLSTDGARIWQLHWQQWLTWSDWNTDRLVPSASGQYVLLGGEAWAPLARLEVVPETEAAPLFVRTPSVSVTGWSLALMHITQPEAMPEIGGGAVTLLWGDTRLAVRPAWADVGDQPTYRLLDYDVLERADGITVAAASPEGVRIYDLDRRGAWLGTRDLPLSIPAWRARMDIAGDPPVVVVGYDSADKRSCVVHVLSAMRSSAPPGEELWHWTGEGSLREVYLSQDARRALVRTPRAIYFLGSDAP